MKGGFNMTIYKDEAKGTWYCQFWYKAWDGTTKHKVKRGFVRKKDAEKWEAKFRELAGVTKLSMDKLITEFLEEVNTKVVLGQIKESTYVTKMNYIDYYIRDYFSKVIDVSLVKPKDVNNWLKKISVFKPKELKPGSRYYEDGKPVKQRLSSSTLNGAKIVLSQLFKFAMSNYGLPENPVDKVESVKPFSNDRRAKYWTLEQYNKFHDSITNPTYQIYFNLLYWAGLRIGEVGALTPSDIKPYKLTITKGIMKLKYKNDKVSTPKTKTSIREVEIPRFLFFQLQDYISKLYGIRPKDRIFDVNEQTIRGFLNTQAAKLELPRISPHILRHSYASTLYNLSKDITVVAKQIGHKDASITLKYYSHMLPTEDRKAIDLLESSNKNADDETIDIIDVELN
ncbi:MAG: site-specific integrase [Opitutales bacterium]|nr:site-specific integrase [Opitutales bacterium]